MRDRLHFALVLLSISVFVFSGFALAIPATQWMQSGTNFVWVGTGHVDGGTQFGLTLGGGTSYAPDRHDFALRGLALDYEWFQPPPMTNDTPTPLDGGQYFCYVVDGNVAVTSQFFAPQQYSFACSDILPYLDLSPTNLLQPPTPGTYTVATWDAGFVGSVFRGDAGWQPWFRNGEQVLFDILPQLPANPTVPGGTGAIPGQNSLPTIDPGMVLGTVVFTPTGPAQRTIALPTIIDVGEVIELQLTNQGLTANRTYPPAQIKVLAEYPASYEQASVIGEATVGGMLSGAGAGLEWNNGLTSGYVRVSTYALDSSDYIFNFPPNSLTLDITDTALAMDQAVTVALVLHGYHEPIK